MQRIILTGRLGQNPQVSTLDDGVKVAQFSVAVTERGYKKKNGTEVPEHTDWIPCVLWRSFAETAEKYLKKGDMVLLEGKLRVRSYADKNGIRRVSFCVHADGMQMLGGSKSDTQQNSQQNVPAENVFQAPQGNLDPSVAATAFSVSEDENDLPF